MGNKTLLDTWLYKQTFSKLTVSPQILQEVIDMTETKRKPKRFFVRRLLVAALVLALALALAMGANAATGGQLFENVLTFVTYTEDGESVMVALNGEDFDMDEDGIVYHISENDNGKVAMAYNDSDGNTVIQDIQFPVDMKDLIGKALEEANDKSSPAVETEARKSTDVSKP